jgi:hypothetical protein
MVKIEKVNITDTKLHFNALANVVNLKKREIILVK